jgi:hypothetical protein
MPCVDDRPMEIRFGSLFFPEVEGEGPQTADATVRFPRAARRAVAGITGYSATFEGDDHHLGRLQMELETFVDSVDPQNVIVRGTFALRDWSGTFDDTYTGTVQFAVIGDLIPIVVGPTRGDLIVVDLEVNQAVQHFRDQFHLDAANVFPDNSIRLVADKPTGIRAYVDYDRSSGLPLISALTGNLEVRDANGAGTNISAINSIVPRRDSQVDRAIANHTLNFVIPESLCRGLVTLRCQVADVFDTTQISEVLEKQVLFEDLPPLPVFAVGVDYTGPDVTDGGVTSAPTQADFVNTLMLTETLYPIPNVNITGYQVMTYDKELESNIANGCDKMGDLKDAIGDLRGDSTDVFYGLFNTGVITGSVGGCGGSSAGAGVGPINAQSTAAHEIGHVLGRQHAPCDNVSRCDQPKNTDDDYPLYAGFDSDSIGEYGFDTRNGNVKDPAPAHDFMGYSGGAWVSPYTYKALLSRIPGAVDGAGASFTSAADAAGIFTPRRRDRPEWRPMKEQRLFVNLRIQRDRRVEFRPAFHFPSFPTPGDPRPTNFVIEFLDETGEVLVADCLRDIGDPCCSCCDPKLWPKRIVQGVPYDVRARKLVIYENDKPIHEQKIPDPPKVSLTCTAGETDAHLDHLSFAWTAGGGGSSAPEAATAGPWFVLLWRDRAGTWRGVMPRTQALQTDVPKRLFGRQDKVAVRLLASAGVATGSDMWEGELRVARVPPRRRGPVVVLQGVDATAKGTQALSPLLRAVVADRYGAQIAAPEMLWVDGRGAEIARGRSLDLRRLSPGQHVVRAVVLDTGAGGAVASWLIERDRNDGFRLVRGNIAGDG